MAAHLPNLESFNITGCPKVTERGIQCIVSATHSGLRSLGLESVSSSFNMRAFAAFCVKHNSLKQLSSITLTLSRQLGSGVRDWAEAVVELLSQSSLEKFNVYAASGGSIAELWGREDLTGPSFSATAQWLWKEIARAHRHTLKRFSVLRFSMDVKTVEQVCRQCENLEELFILAEFNWLVSKRSPFCPPFPC